MGSLRDFWRSWGSYFGVLAVGVCKEVKTLLLFWKCLTEVTFWGVGGLEFLGRIGRVWVFGGGWGFFVIFEGLGLFWGLFFFEGHRAFGGLRILGRLVGGLEILGG